LKIFSIHKYAHRAKSNFPKNMKIQKTHSILSKNLKIFSIHKYAKTQSKEQLSRKIWKYTNTKHTAYFQRFWKFSQYTNTPRGPRLDAGPIFDNAQLSTRTPFKSPKSQKLAPHPTMNLSGAQSWKTSMKLTTGAAEKPTFGGS